jgi:hypothetical protein
MLVVFDENIIEFRQQTRYFAEDGIIEYGDSDEVIDTIPDDRFGPTCTTCRKETKQSVIIEKELFLIILRYCYKDQRYPANQFKIDLDFAEDSDLSRKAPTLQQIKEAIVEDAI